jgi:uncharacterized protein YcfJ
MPKACILQPPRKAGNAMSTKTNTPRDNDQEFPFDPVALIRQAFPIAVVAIFCLWAMNSAHAETFSGLARVVQVLPQMQRYNQPQRVCESVPVQQYNSQGSRSNSGAVIGAITGGLLGHTVGRGGGRQAAIGVGAAVGAVVGDRMQNDTQQGSTVSNSQCYTVDNWIERPAGAIVTYDYQGHTLTSSLSYVPNYRPGDQVNVSVSVSMY